MKSFFGRFLVSEFFNSHGYKRHAEYAGLAIFALRGLRPAQGGTARSAQPALIMRFRL